MQSIEEFGRNWRGRPAPKVETAGMDFSSLMVAIPVGFRPESADQVDLDPALNRDDQTGSHDPGFVHVLTER